jgi:decaprenyl-phosphate phosphoribosyltransferase
MDDTVDDTTDRGTAVPSAPPSEAPRRPRPWALALLVALRPRQWIKNLLVYAAPLAAAELLHRDVLVDTTVAFLCFCGAASATYLINDVRDREADRVHPRKRFRPIAAGELSPTAAVVAAVVLVVLSLTVAALSTYPAFVVTLLCYLAMTAAYSLGLKNEPVIELAILAGGFVLRAIAGGTATGIPLSPWFLTVAAFGSLFVAAGKRYSEFVSLGPDERDARPGLRHYSATYLRFVWTVSAAVLLTAYCLWAFAIASRARHSVPFAELSVVPFVLAVLRLGLDIDQGEVGEPEELALRDRVLQVLALLWVLTFALGAAGV